MSRRGDCYDNAVAESFFDSFKTEVDYEGLPRTDLTACANDYIDRFYNPLRMHTTIDDMSPVDFEHRYFHRTPGITRDPKAAHGATDGLEPSGPLLQITTLTKGRPIRMPPTPCNSGVPLYTGGVNR